MVDHQATGEPTHGAGDILAAQCLEPIAKSLMN
jgi:hypothetical protein